MVFVGRSVPFFGGTDHPRVHAFRLILEAVVLRATLSEPFEKLQGHPPKAFALKERVGAMAVPQLGAALLRNTLKVYFQGVSYGSLA